METLKRHPSLSGAVERTQDFKKQFAGSIDRARVYEAVGAGPSSFSEKNSKNQINCTDSPPDEA